MRAEPPIRWRKRIRPLPPLACLLAAVAILATVSGCGGESPPATQRAGGAGARAGGARSAAGGAGRPSAAVARFIASADAICREVRARTRSLPDSYARRDLAGISEARARSLVERVVDPGLEREIRRIVELRRPPAATQTSQAILNAIAEMIVQSQAHPRSFLLERRAVAESRAKARAAGFRVCGGL